MKYYPLDNEQVIALIETQNLKRWWVAEIVGIHKTTLRRWLSKKISRVREDRIKKLAVVLQANWIHLVNDNSRI